MAHACRRRTKLRSGPRCGAACGPLRASECAFETLDGAGARSQRSTGEWPVRQCSLMSRRCSRAPVTALLSQPLAGGPAASAFTSALMPFILTCRRDGASVMRAGMPGFSGRSAAASSPPLQRRPIAAPACRPSCPPDAAPAWRPRRPTPQGAPSRPGAAERLFPRRLQIRGAIPTGHRAAARQQLGSHSHARAVKCAAGQ